MSPCVPRIEQDFLFTFFVRAGCEIVTYLRLFLERKLLNTERWRGGSSAYSYV
jgi:hypothetical protein